jgi:MFS family permease
MGGIWGLAASTALENLPVEARGLASGVLQQGYAVGYLLAAVINLTLVERTDNWRTLFWCAAGISAFAAAIRVCLPESEFFVRAREVERKKVGGGLGTGEKTKVFLRETREMLKRHWVLCIYAVLLMTGGGFPSFPFFKKEIWRETDWFCVLVSRIQLPIPWIPRSIPHLPPNFERLLKPRRDDRYYHRELCTSRFLFSL